MRKLIIAPLVLLIFLCPRLFAQDNIDFRYQTLNGEDLNFASFTKEKPILVTFWALWCEPCRIELRKFQTIFDKYTGADFAILAINQDSPKSVAKVRAFVGSRNLSFPVALDPNGEIFQKFNGQSIPFSLLYNKEGKMVYKHVGYIPGDEKILEAEIQKVLGSAK